MKSISEREIVRRLHLFINDEESSLENAGQIEAMLDELYPDDDEIQDYVTYFASYRPNGGEFLYDKADMIKKIRNLLELLNDR